MNLAQKERAAAKRRVASRRRARVTRAKQVREDMVGSIVEALLVIETSKRAGNDRFSYKMDQAAFIIDGLASSGFEFTKSRKRLTLS